MRVGRQILYASTIAAVGLGARSIVRGPLPIEVVAASIATFSAIVLAGVFEPRLAMFADVVNDGDPTPERPRVALTFDDGPGPRTLAVADQLDAHDVKGTFFVVGRKLVGDGARTARELHRRGHGIGCHSFAHDRFFALRGTRRVRDDVRRALATIEDTLGVKTTLFRPPIGHTNPIIARVAEELSLTVVGYSVRALDGIGRRAPDKIARRIVRGLRDGALPLLHDAAERDDFDPASIDALPAILSEMRARSLAGVTVDDLLA